MAQLPSLLYLVALSLLLLQAALGLFQYARFAVAALRFPFPLDYHEGPTLDQIVRLAQAENIYRNSFATPPYTVTTNPPLFQLLQVPAVWLFGPAFGYGRLLSLLCAAAAAALIGLLLHAVTADRGASILGALTFLSFPYALQLSVLDRVELLGLSLSLAGLYACVRWPSDRRALWVAGVLFTVAVYAHPGSALAAPLAALLWLGQSRQRRQAVALGAGVALGSLGLLLLANWLTRGGFVLNVVSANLPGFSWYTLVRHGVELYLHAGYLLIACLGFLVVERLREPTRSWPLVAAYLLGAALTAVPSVASAASMSYPLQAVGGLCLATGALLAWAGENHWFRLLLVLVLTLQISELARWTRDEYFAPLADKVSSYREVAQLATLVRDAPATVLADEYMGLIPLNGRRLYFQPLEFRRLQEAGLWNQAGLIASIDQQAYSAILLYEPPSELMISVRWTPELRQAIYAHYKSARTLDWTLVYLPSNSHP